MIYLDYAATTPTDKKILKKMLPYFGEKFGNASSVHSFGQEAVATVDKARGQVANFLGADFSEIIFTSGATESNNLAIKGVILGFKQIIKEQKPHIITTAIEHPCVLHTCQELEKRGIIDLSVVTVNKNGLVEIEKIQAELRANTALVSIMFVNNEIGTVQPIEKIGKMLKTKNAKRKNKILFHTDAVQAISYFDCNVEKLGVDLLSFSGHKIYGPKGVGALYIKKGTLIRGIQNGGEQEYGLRAGTYNVPGIVGIGEAIENIKNQKEDSNKVLKLKNYLIKEILQKIPNSYLNGSKEKRSPNNANFRFDNVEGEALLLSLDMEGICASTGSACSSGSLDPSHVLLALGLKHEEAHGSLRLTLGKYTNKKEIDFVVNKIKEVVERLRKISGKILEEF